MGRLQKGSAHEPSPLARELHCERLRRSQVAEILGVMRVRSLSFTPLNRPLQGSRSTWEHRSGIRDTMKVPPNSGCTPGGSQGNRKAVRWLRPVCHCERSEAIYHLAD